MKAELEIEGELGCTGDLNCKAICFLHCVRLSICVYYTVVEISIKLIILTLCFLIFRLRMDLINMVCGITGIPSFKRGGLGHDVHLSESPESDFLIFSGQGEPFFRLDARDSKKPENHTDKQG